MASKTQKSDAGATPKKEAAAKVETPTAKEVPKDTPKDTPKADSGETAARSGYSRGEGQKPVTAAYKENWNAIFGKKKTKKKKR
ncbi:MAG: hypothetical protein KGQ47_14295 [Hyphomicrobiales bacterium]|nr:hypothetical protein [Hyphomicrobiales bacterium]MDE1973166.1 hypothetical protein [Hyphomicrobiales bacterium]